jgi:hypothetical protein
MTTTRLSVGLVNRCVFDLAGGVESTLNEIYNDAKKHDDVTKRFDQLLGSVQRWTSDMVKREVDILQTWVPSVPLNNLVAALVLHPLVGTDLTESVKAPSAVEFVHCVYIRAADKMMKTPGSSFRSVSEESIRDELCSRFPLEHVVNRIIPQLTSSNGKYRLGGSASSADSERTVSERASERASETSEPGFAQVHSSEVVLSLHESEVGSSSSDSVHVPKPGGITLRTNTDSDSEINTQW